MNLRFWGSLTNNKFAWFLLAFIALLLESSALFFQYGLKLEPCIMCIYQRAALWAIVFAGVTGGLGVKYLLARITAYILWAIGALWGLLLAVEHVEIQRASSSPLSFMYSCDIVPNFPAWAPLHEWIPSLFAATGDCGEIAWQFLGFSMPEWMIVVFSLLSMALALVASCSLLVNKRL